MAHGKNRKANKPYGERGPSVRKSGPRKIARFVEVENEPLDEGWFYRIERWEMSTGGTEFELEVYQVNNVGVQLGSWSRWYGELDHAQAAITKLYAEARSKVEPSDPPGGQIRGNKSTDTNLAGDKPAKRA